MKRRTGTLAGLVRNKIVPAKALLSMVKSKRRKYPDRYLNAVDDSIRELIAISRLPEIENVTLTRRIKQSIEKLKAEDLI